MKIILKSSIVLAFVFLISSLGISAPSLDINTIIMSAGNERTDPLHTLKLINKNLDEELSQENRKFITNNDELLDNIRHTLAGNQLHWQLNAKRNILAYVPEDRTDYSQSCLEYYVYSVNSLSERLGLKNPYGGFFILDPQENYDIDTTPQLSNINVYIANSIAMVYEEDYSFFLKGKEEKILITVDNREYSGEIGSFSSFLVINDVENAKFSFEYNNYTIWLTHASDPNNVLIVPVEETLHIFLRQATQSAIIKTLEKNQVEDRSAIENTVEAYLSLEEAVVGVLVHKFLPQFLKELGFSNMEPKIRDTITERGENFSKYRLVNKAMENLAPLNFKKLFEIYLQDPDQIRDLINS